MDETAQFESIEETILPSLSLVLDGLIEAAALARPGVDAAHYAVELKAIGEQLEVLRRHVEDAAAPEVQDVRAA
ncbi:MAG TPA: hypothetical protein VGC56_06155 [Allosphingosinicella sp.]|jgi:hypothetical protein